MIKLEQLRQEFHEALRNVYRPTFEEAMRNPKEVRKRAWKVYRLFDEIQRVQERRNSNGA